MMYLMYVRNPRPTGTDPGSHRPMSASVACLADTATA